LVRAARARLVEQVSQSEIDRGQVKAATIELEQA